MRIVQLTDLHLPPTDGTTQLGIDTRQNFLDMLPRVAALKPDLLVISGDLCYDLADVETFRWAREKVEALQIPYAVIAGNHDDSSLLGAAFDLEIRQKEVYFVRQVEQKPVLFLDTALATMSDTQMDWLEKQLAGISGPVVLFMHHPPFPAGMPFMDSNWPFLRSEELMLILKNCAHPVYVFCGHYHNERTIHSGNVHVHITPSLYFQLSAESVEPVVDHTRIALRVIDFREERLLTAVQYFDGYKY